MRFFISSFLLFTFSLIVAQDTCFNQVGFETASVGYVICDAQTGNVVCQHNSQIAFTPASVTKIITVAAALDLLGGDFRFKTELEYDGELKKDGVLNGNLYIKGGGDPTLGSCRLGDQFFIERWVDLLKQKGITCIKGNLIADASLFGDEALVPKWNWEDIGNYYATGVYALSAFDNMSRITLASGKSGTKPKVLKIEPEIDGFCLKNNLMVKNINSDSAYFYGSPLENVRHLYGAIPAEKKNFVIKGDIPNPPLFVVTELYKKLQKSGIDIAGKPIVEFSPKEINRKLLHTNYSSPLSSIVKEVNFYSNNLYAEHIMRYLSLTVNEQATLNASIYTVKKYLKELGLDINGLFLFDGSGLSFQNAISPLFFANLLCKMMNSKEFDVFYNSFPIAGESGTVSSFLKNSSLAGKVRVKSGSFGQVQCYTGYIAKKYTFAVMVNNFYCPRKTVIHSIENWLQQIDLR